MRKNKNRGNKYYSNSDVMGFSKKLWKFIIIIGGRGVGKTYSTWKYVIKRWKKTGEKFVWLRANEAATKKLLASGGLKLIPKELLRKYRINLRVNGTQVFFNNVYAGEVLGLSTFASGKGTSYDKGIKTIVLDEFNREKTEKNDLDIAYAFYNQIETIARLRTDIRVIMLGNSIAESSELMAKLFNFVPEPGKFGLYKLTKKRALVHYVENSDKYDKEREASLAGLLIKNSAVDTGSMTNKVKTLGALLTMPWEQAKDAKFMYRIWFSNTVCYDVYMAQFAGKGVVYVVDSAKRPNGTPTQIVASRQLVSSDAPYKEDIVSMLIEQFDTGRVVFDTNATATSFKTWLLAVKK